MMEFSVSNSDELPIFQQPTVTINGLGNSEKGQETYFEDYTA